MRLLLISMALFFLASSMNAQDFHKDIIPTNGGDLTITFIGHGTLMFEYQDKVIHIDPWSQLADYSKLPKADAILITHEHGDHLDPKAIEQIEKEETQILLPKLALDQLGRGTLFENYQYKSAAGIPVEAIPAYNTLGKRGNGKPYHPKGDGNGYILSFYDVRVYVAGDTEIIPEMKNMQMINIAFLPMNLPYTMTPEMVAAAALVIKPKILYPYHFGDTQTEILVKLLLDSDIDVRIRAMK